MNYWIWVIALQQVSAVNFCDAWYALCRGVHGPYTPWTAANTAVYRVHDRIHGVYGRVPYTRSCTLYTAVFTARVHGRLYGPCTGAAHVQVHDARAVYMVRPWPEHGCVHGRTWPCTLYTAVFTACVHGHAQAVYMVRPWPEHGRARLRTLYTGVFTACVHSRVRTVNTAVFRACLHGRVPCSRCVYGKCRRPFAAVFPMYKPCTIAVDRVHGCSRRYARPVHGRVQGPYTAVDGRVHRP